MNLITARLMAVGLAVSLVGGIRLLETVGLERAAEGCAVAVLVASVAVFAADRLL